MIPQHHLPADIERTSLSIITAELEALGLTPPPETAAVVKRVIHTTADFDYAKNLRFTPGAVAAGVAALRAGTPIITDTNMALSGISKPALARLGGSASATWRTLRCADRSRDRNHPGSGLHAPRGAGAPRGHPCGGQCPHRPAGHCGGDRGRAAACSGHRRAGGLCECGGKQGSAVCRLCSPRRACIAAMGRKGGSTVAAAVCNALVYSAAEMLDCGERMEIGRNR